MLTKAKAWGAHAVTSSGVILALLALLALVDGQPKGCLMWLGIALLVLGIVVAVPMILWVWPL